MIAERLRAKRETMLEMVARGIRPHIAHALIQAREENEKEEAKRREALTGKGER